MLVLRMADERGRIEMSDLSKESEAREWVTSWRAYYATRVVEGGDLLTQRDRFLDRVAMVAKEQRGLLDAYQRSAATRASMGQERLAEYERAVVVLETVVKGGAL